MFVNFLIRKDSLKNDVDHDGNIVDFILRQETIKPTKSK